MTDSVRSQAEGAVTTITLNRPQSRNALTAEMKDALLAALQQAGSDPAARAVVLTGAGGAFCAGQDLREHAELLASGSAALDTVRAHYNPIITTVMTMPKPVVAAIRGSAAGAGAGLALACDFRVAAQGSSLLMAFARVGLAADSGVSWTLQRLVGPARAAELLMLAEPIDCDRALSAGLLTAVVEEPQLDTAARDLAARLAAGPTAAYAAIKEQILLGAGHSLADALEIEARLQTKLGQTADHRNATLAFLRKEQPTFEGR